MYGALPHTRGLHARSKEAISLARRDARARSLDVSLPFLQFGMSSVKAESQEHDKRRGSTRSENNIRAWKLTTTATYSVFESMAI